MPRYYCDYCDVYLTHDSSAGRKQHNNGRRHQDNVRQYYMQFLKKSFIPQGMVPMAVPTAIPRPMARPMVNPMMAGGRGVAMRPMAAPGRGMARGGYAPRGGFQPRGGMMRGGAVMGRGAPQRGGFAPRGRGRY